MGTGCMLGYSFVEYVLRLRIRDATVRLASTDEAVARIASDCGFADVKAFNVAFKKHFNMTPQPFGVMLLLTVQFLLNLISMSRHLLLLSFSTPHSNAHT